MSIEISVIVPTHNRAASIKNLLNCFSRQQHQAFSFEVIVIADGCTDNTVELLSEMQLPFPFQLGILPGLGAAAARNKGAALAQGPVLIFLDDDMLPCDEFIAEHLYHHQNVHDVVIGYSPLQLEAKAGIYRKILREWWEKKFARLRLPGHRFRYDDLTSGNFSIAADLFHSVGGFDTALLCREDYEFGFRLIRAGAQFHFAEKAKAVHCDAVTTLVRSLQRKRMEGIADVQIKNKHPEFVNAEAAYYISKRSTYKTFLLTGMQLVPKFFDSLAALGLNTMKRFEKLGMRNAWMTSSYRLHQYWYLRGLMQSSGTAKKLRRTINRAGMHHSAGDVSIDLAQGIDVAEKEIDVLRPTELKIFFGDELIGELHYEPGAEPLKGSHLRRILRDRFGQKLSSVLIRPPQKEK